MNESTSRFIGAIAIAVIILVAVIAFADNNNPANATVDGSSRSNEFNPVVDEPISDTLSGSNEDAFNYETPSTRFPDCGLSIGYLKPC